MAGDEIHYLLPQGVDLKAAGEMFGEQFSLEHGPARSVDRQFYDTFDGRLHACGLALTHENGKLGVADAAGQTRASVEQLTPPARLFAWELPQGPLRDALDPITDVRALTRLVLVRGPVQPLRVLDDERKTVVRMVLEAPSVVGAGGAHTRLAARVRVLPVRGYDKALTRVRATLARELGLSEGASSLQDEAVAAAGGTPGGVSAKLDVRLEPGERADHATAVALGAPLATMTATLPGALADVDSEFLHDFRVAVRRTRSLQRQLAPVFPQAPLAQFRAEFRRLQQVTGEVRDLDVHLIELARFRCSAPGAVGDDLKTLQEMLADRRRAEQRRMRRALGSPRTTGLLDGWAGLLDGLGALPDADRPDATAPIAAVVARRIRRVYRRMVKMGRVIDDSSPAEALHDLRKQGKELRYLLEFFACLYPLEVVRPMVRTLKGLQDVLGRFQDQEVQAATLRALREEVATREGGAAALMAMGVLVERLERDHAAARAEFADRFAPFAAQGQRRLVEREFA